MRLVSDILESNDLPPWRQSAVVSLALMDAGVPIRSACAELHGLVVEGDKTAVLTDIDGPRKTTTATWTSRR